jgi:DNA (cytosine-5)-methyltransferase 1
VLPDSEILKYRLGDGTVIVQGDTVELTNDKQLMPDTNQSGDFFRVKNIIVNHQTDNVRLRGYRLRRTKYLSQLFDCKYNLTSRRCKQVLTRS